VIFYAHGQFETTADLERFFALFQSRNYNMVSWDAPCHGVNPGDDPNEESVSVAGLTTLKWLAAKSPDTPIILWGQSLGAAVVLQVFQRNLSGAKIPIRGIVAISPWTNYKEACKDLAPGGLFCREGQIGENLFDNVAAAKSVNVPIMFVWKEGDKKVLKKRSVEVMQSVPAGFAQSIELDKGVAHEHLADTPNLQRVADWVDGHLVSQVMPTKKSPARLPAKSKTAN